MSVCLSVCLSVSLSVCVCLSLIHVAVSDIETRLSKPLAHRKLLTGFPMKGVPRCPHRVSASLKDSQCEIDSLSPF